MKGKLFDYEDIKKQISDRIDAFNNLIGNGNK